MSLTEALDWLQAIPMVWAYGILFGAAFIEYVLPPFPGDLVVVTGVVMATSFQWPLSVVFALVTLGAMLGALVDFELGRLLQRRQGLHRLPVRGQRAVQALVKRFERHGDWYLAVNRFLPGVRAFFFVAAGLAGLSRRSVLLWSTVSAVAWNGLLVAMGYSLGKNIDTLELWLSRYTIIAWCLVATVLLVLLIRIQRDDGDAPEGPEKVQ